MYNFPTSLIAPFIILEVKQHIKIYVLWNATLMTRQVVPLEHEDVTILSNAQNHSPCD